MLCGEWWRKAADEEKVNAPPPPPLRKRTKTRARARRPCFDAYLPPRRTWASAHSLLRPPLVIIIIIVTITIIINVRDPSVGRRSEENRRRSGHRPS